MVNLETERLTVRNFVAADWEALHEIIAQYQSSEFAAYDGRWPTSPEEFKRVVEWFAENDGFMAVCLKNAGRLIGFIASNPEGDKEKGEYNLGYIFNFVYHSKGYATEACRVSLMYTFGELLANKVVTGTAADNLASLRLLERLGFRRTDESVGSLQNKPDGTPIMFQRYRYELTREVWYSLEQHHTSTSRN